MWKIDNFRLIKSPKSSSMALSVNFKEKYLNFGIRCPNMQRAEKSA